MRFRIKAGGPAARFTFDRTPKPQPPAPPVLRAADLDNPYGRYYGKARSWEDILKNKKLMDGIDGYLSDMDNVQ
mgnify:CR=1 FL=1